MAHNRFLQGCPHRSQHIRPGQNAQTGLSLFQSHLTAHQAHVHFPDARAIRHLQALHLVQGIIHQLLEIALPYPYQAEHAQMRNILIRQIFQKRHHGMFHHRLQLRRRPRQQDEHGKGTAGRHHQSGRRPVGILQHRGAIRNHGLLEITLRNGNPPPFKITLQPLSHTLVTVHVHAAHVAQGFPGHIIARRPQSPAYNHDICAPGALPHGLVNSVTVGHDGYPPHTEPGLK